MNPRERKQQSTLKRVHACTEQHRSQQAEDKDNLNVPHWYIKHGLSIHRVLFNPKEELGMDTRYNVDEPQGHCLQRNSEPGTKAHILCESTDMDHSGKSVEMESVLVVAKEWNGG